MTLDGIDFTFCSATVDHTEPESLIHEFMILTRLKIDCIRYDGAAEFAKSVTFKAFCVNNHIAMEETAAYTHTFNASAQGAVRIVKEHMRCLLRRANFPRRFWPYAMLHFCRVYAHWPNK
jgi:Cys-tRNA synthase (O-phospho-L-seryl-tRNA:Cys-tRNA synthase)